MGQNPCLWTCVTLVYTRDTSQRDREGIKGLIPPLSSVFITRRKSFTSRHSPRDSEQRPFCFHLLSSLSLSLSHSSFTRFFSTAFASLPLRIKFNTPVSWLIIFLHEILQASPVLRNGTPWLESRILTPSLHDGQLEFSLRILSDFPRKFYEIVSFSSFWN